MTLSSDTAGRSANFNATTGSMSWNYRSAAEHPDRCVCQGKESTPHKHRDDGSCARCVECKSYTPAIPAPIPSSAAPTDEEMEAVASGEAAHIPSLHKPRVASDSAARERVAELVAAAGNRTTLRFCCGCGLLGQPESADWHTRSDHANDRSCHVGDHYNCPVPVQCGPMVEVAVFTKDELADLLASPSSGGGTTTDAVLQAMQDVEREQLIETVRVQAKEIADLNATCSYWEKQYAIRTRELATVETSLAELRLPRSSPDALAGDGGTTKWHRCPTWRETTFAGGDRRGQQCSKQVGHAGNHLWLCDSACPHTRCRAERKNLKARRSPASNEGI